MTRIFFKTLWNNRRRNILVFIELFMISLVLVNLTVYFVNMISIIRIKNCYDTNNVVMVNINIKNKEDNAITEQAFSNLKKVIAANPFVQSVSISNNAIPYNYNINNDEFKHDSDRFYLAIRQVDIDYGKVMTIRALKGRWFNETDAGKAVQPIIISREIDEKYFDGNAVGKRMFRGGHNNTFTEFEVVGVIDRFKRSDIEYPIPVGYFLKDSIRAYSYWETTVLIRTKENKTSEMLAVAESQVYSTLNPENWTISGLNALENMREKQNIQNYQQNYLKAIIGLFIMINIFLGTVGILWYNTNLRIHEIGIRRALGSSGTGIKRLLITENIVIAVAGLLIVVLIMLHVPAFIRSEEMEPGVQTISVLISAFTMIILVLLSTWIPAALASKIKPASALKTE